MDEQEYETRKNEYLKLDFAKTAYEKSVASYENTVKKFSSLLIALSSLITAVAGLFTCYCICSPKNSVTDYILFAINCVLILTTLITDLHGYGLSELLKKNGKDYDFLGKTTDIIENESEIKIELNFTEGYLKTAKQIDEQTKKKRKILTIAMILTALTAVMVLATVIKFLI